MSTAISIEQLDPNFIISEEITEENIVWLDAKTVPFSLHGIFYDDSMQCFLRMSASVAETVSKGVADLNHCTAGGRIRFVTDSDFIGIKAVQKNRPGMRHMPRTGQSGFDLYRKKEGDLRPFYYTTFKPAVTCIDGFSASLQTDGVLAEYTLNFPLYDKVSEVYIALRKGCRIEAPRPYQHPKPVLFYGSSITQGGCATRPGNSYQGMLSVLLDTDYINLGFSGNAKGEPAMAEYIAKQEMSVFVCDYDHNAPNAEYLEQTHLPFYRIVRAAQPNLPIVFVSAPDVGKEHQYAPRRAVVRKTYETAIAEGDRNVYYIDGSTFYHAIDLWDCTTVDGIHPTDLGFYLMAKGMEKVLKSLLGKA